MSWQRITDSSVGEFAVLLRVFGWQDKGYPRIALGLYRDVKGNEGHGIYVSVHQKKSPKTWWKQANLPVELIGELQEMLAQVKETDGR